MFDLEEKIEQVEENKFDYKKHIVNVSDVDKDLDNFLTGKIPQGFKIGYSTLDDYFVCKKNEFYVLTGKKGRGKTTINQALQVMFSIANGLIWVVSFQENSYWSMKLNYLNYILCDYAKDVKKNDPELYNKASEWIDKHFIFIDVDDIKTATEVTKGLIQDGVDVHALLLDPINSFRNGWQDTGNDYADGVVAGREILQFTKKYCSVHISQHPKMSAQRQEGAISSYQGEGGWYLNKASFTYVIHRESGSNENEIIIDNVRNKHTGGSETEFENPVVVFWNPTTIDLGDRQMGVKEENVIKRLKTFYNPLNENFETTISGISPQEAFTEDDDMPF